MVKGTMVEKHLAGKGAFCIKNYSDLVRIVEADCGHHQTTFGLVGTGYFLMDPEHIATNVTMCLIF